MAVLMAAMSSYAQTTPPAEAEQKEYSFFGLYHDANYGDSQEETTVLVAVDGTDLYIQMPNPVNGQAWIKGTISGETATFAPQAIGVHGGTTYYITGRSEGDVIGNVVFSYSESMMSCNDQYVQFSDDLAGQNVYAYFTSIIINQPGEDEVMVTVPEGLQTSPYEFSGQLIKYDEEGGIAGFEQKKRDIKVGFNGTTEVYVQGLCEQLPEGWVKGIVKEGSFGSKTVTFAAGQCFGTYGLYPLYLVCRNRNELTQMVYIYDPETREFKNDNWNYLVINASRNQPMAVETYASSTLTPKSASGIASSTRDEGQTIAYTDLQGRPVTAQVRGLLLKTVRQHDGTLKTTKVLK